MKDNTYVAAQFKEHIRSVKTAIGKAEQASWVSNWELADAFLKEAQDALHSTRNNAGYLDRIQDIVPGVGFVGKINRITA
jgi:hypothetical protein